MWCYTGVRKTNKQQHKQKEDERKYKMVALQYLQSLYPLSEEENKENNRNLFEKGKASFTP